MTRRSLVRAGLACAAPFFTSALPANAGFPVSMGGPPARNAARGSWPLWNAYTDRFLDWSGRIVDYDENERTTSEAQAYALFFALVANDRARFERLLSWTVQNLFQGEPDSRLPAWLWGNKSGRWGVLDQNSASDADLWLTYSLLEAGRLWNERRYTALGQSLERCIRAQEVKDIPGLGPMLMPAPYGFLTSDGFYQLNASYLPVQLLLGVSNHVPKSPWSQIAETAPRVITSSAPAGFFLDWIAYRPGEDFSPDPVPPGEPCASYDAIRVYLWAGMLPTGYPAQNELLASSYGMTRYLRRNSAPPAEVSPNGQVKNASGNAGFSAALLPFLAATHEPGPFKQQEQRLRDALSPATGLYGSKPRYYDQNLALFATGWLDGRFRFDEKGLLRVSWR